MAGSVPYEETGRMSGLGERRENAPLACAPFLVIVIAASGVPNLTSRCEPLDLS